MMKQLINRISEFTEPFLFNFAVAVMAVGLSIVVLFAFGGFLMIISNRIHPIAAVMVLVFVLSLIIAAFATWSDNQ